jgi:transposase
VAPEWLREVISDDWFDRYSSRFDDYRLPKKKNEREQMAIQIGLDGHHLLHQIWFRGNAQLSLQKLSSVEILRCIWIQQYSIINCKLHWRTKDTTGFPQNSICIESPYDIDARNSSKRDLNWTGYSVHLTETCDKYSPNLITNVETTTATTPDGDMTPVIHANLAEKDLLPNEHYVDAAFVDSYQLVESHQKYEVSMVGRVAVDSSWQASLNMGFDVAAFTIDWNQQVAKCPQGHLSKSWRPSFDSRKNPVIQIQFERKTCIDCPVRKDCTKSVKRPRTLKIRPQIEYEALTARRIEQQTEEFKKKYGLRAGIEGTISQGVRKFDMRRTRYFGLAKTHLQHVATACAINLHRFFHWSNNFPKAKTRITAFASLHLNVA